MTFKYYGYRVAQWLSTSLPPATAFTWAQRVADAHWRRSRRDRAIVQQNLSTITGSPVSHEAPIIREVFRNFGRYVVEFFTIHKVPHPQVDLEGYERLTEIRRQRRGAIILSAHLGNWEVGAILLRRLGFPVTAVALPHEDPRMNRLFDAQRHRCGIQVIPLGPQAAARSLQRLRAGECLGLLGDRAFADNNLTVSWFGRRAWLPRGPATLSLRSRAPIVPTFLIREGPWKFRFCFETPIDPGSHTEGDQAIQQLTEAYAATLERRLRRHPDQWLMFQPLGERGKGRDE